jgi:hypothetical protein
LDPHGQYARVSIKAITLWAAAFNNEAIPFDDSDDISDAKQLTIFDDESAS